MSSVGEVGWQQKCIQLHTPRLSYLYIVFKFFTHAHTHTSFYHVPHFALQRTCACRHKHTNTDTGTHMTPFFLYLLFAIKKSFAFNKTSFRWHFIYKDRKQKKRKKRHANVGEIIFLQRSRDATLPCRMGSSQTRLTSLGIEPTSQDCIHAAWARAETSREMSSQKKVITARKESINGCC